MYKFRLHMGCFVNIQMNNLYSPPQIAVKFHLLPRTVAPSEASFLVLSNYRREVASVGIIEQQKLSSLQKQLW